mgnify:CR=1 FL=1
MDDLKTPLLKPVPEEKHVKTYFMLKGYNYAQDYTKMSKKELFQFYMLFMLSVDERHRQVYNCDDLEPVLQFLVTEICGTRVIDHFDFEMLERKFILTRKNSILFAPLPKGVVEMKRTRLEKIKKFYSSL